VSTSTLPGIEETPRPAPPARDSGRLGYLPAFDGIRAIAVLAVVAYHFNYTWAGGGHLGVDTFFILSGFLITSLLLLETGRNGRIAFGSFWARRARRLLPALLLVLIFVAIYNQYGVQPWLRTSVRDDSIASLFYVANWRFIADKQSYFQLFSAASPLRHMWSLAIEEQYYLVWPLIVAACVKIGKGSHRVLVGVCALGIAASVASMWTRYTPGDPSSAYYATDARAQFIFVGALLGILFLNWTPSPRAKVRLAAAAIPAFVIMLLALSRVSGTAPGYYKGGGLLYASVAAVVIFGVLQPGPIAWLLSIEPLLWIGRLSYGIYLWHWPMDVWITPSRTGLTELQNNALRLLMTFVFAAVSYYLVERPIRQKKWSPGLTAAVFVPAVAITLAIILASSSGASPPPSYIWGLGDPLVCGQPRPAETAEATRADAKFGVPLDVAPAAKTARVLIVGDSTACATWTGMRVVGRDSGIKIDQGSVFGCGIASGQVTTTRNESIGPNSQRCPTLVETTVTAALARARPTVVIWMSSWEKSDLVVDGKTYIAGTPAGEREIQSLMDDALQRLTAGGAHVVLVTVPAPAPNPAQATQTTSKSADDAGYVRLRGILERFHARHPDKTSIVDLASKVCPGGPPCGEIVEGLHARPDGRHFTPTAAVWASRWLLQQIFPAHR
jgi:peptidoglycan/LPS O-acetylase OafA/YrhL